MNYYKPNKDKSLFSINEAVQRALKITNYNVQNHQIEVKTIIDEELFANGYINEFVQVIVSILSNIYDIKNIRKIPLVHINVEMKKDGSDALVSISDDAQGIDKEILPKIFNPYFTTKHQSQGTGLGLHIAKTIIENNMNGSLSVKNNQKGATFTIRMKNEN
jgi:signal transduction histidine kinase